MYGEQSHPSNPVRNADGEVVAATDWLGNVFHVGDTVMYCIGAGRGQLMATGKVLRIKAETRYWRMSRLAQEDEKPDYVGHGGKDYVEYQKPYDNVTVQVLTSKTSGKWDGHQRTRPAWVNPINITALPITELP